MSTSTIPPQRVPFLDPRTLAVSREWYLFLQNIRGNTEESRVSIEDIGLAPVPQVFQQDNPLPIIQQVAGQVGDLESRVHGLECLPRTPDQRFFINGARFGINGFNCTTFDSSGHQTMRGDARPWRDELTDALNIKTVGTRATVNASENTVEFTNLAQIATDYCHLNIQLNHDKDTTASIYPHIHFFQDNNAVPNFLLQYRWQVNGGAKVTSWTNLICNTLAFTYTSGTINQIAYSAAIAPPVGSDLSDIVQFRICRDTDNDSTLFAGADPYTGTVGFSAFDVHFMLSSIGSDTEYNK